MAGQALYLKYRPHVFDDMIGQEHITRTLRNTLSQGRLRHAYLFSGPRGTGKTTTARLLAKAVNCTYPDPAMRPCDQCEACLAVNQGRYLDLIEIDAASNNGVDDVRELREKIGFSPNEGRYKVYVVDEVHRFSPSAFDALLKTLEEPPEHAIFILATTEMDKVPQTIKSRCLKFEFRRVSTREVADRLEAIANLEGLHIDRAALELVARQGTGSVRDSISLLDQIVSDPNEQITLEIASAILGTANHQAVGHIVNAILESDAGRGLEILNQAIDEGADPRQMCGQLIEHLRNVLLTQTGGSGLVEGSDDQRAQYAAQAEKTSRAVLLKAVKAFNSALNEMRASWQPQLPLELALVESTRPAVEEVTVVQRPAPVKSKSKNKQPDTDHDDQAGADPDADLDSLPEAAIGATTISEVRNRWSEVLGIIGSHEQTSHVVHKIAIVTPKAIEGNTLVLLLDEANRTLYNNVNDDWTKKVIQRAILRAMEVSVNIRIVIGGEAAGNGAEKSAESVPDRIATLNEELGGKVRPKKK